MLEPRAVPYLNNHSNLVSKICRQMAPTVPRPLKLGFPFYLFIRDSNGHEGDRSHSTSVEGEGSRS